MSQAMNTTLETAVQAVRIYSETHPRPPHVTQKQAAAMLHVSVPSVTKLIRNGRLSLNGLGLIPIGQIDAILVAARTEQ